MSRIAEPLRLAVIVSHPIQHFAPWHRAIAARGKVKLKVLFCCDWGAENYHDPEFGISVKWDMPLLEGYDHLFLPIRKRPAKLDFWQVDNPAVTNVLENYRPDVIQLFGYAHRTNWRALLWAHRAGVPVLLFSDSSGRATTGLLKRRAKEVVVRQFYSRIDGALAVGDNNREYHRHYGLPNERIFPGCLPVDVQWLYDQVPDCAEIRQQLRERFSVAAEEFILLFCGKFSARKRPLDLIRALKRFGSLKQRVHALFVGEGTERATLEREAGMDLGSTIHLAGFANQTEIPRYYAGADALVVTSAADPHPLVVTEAAAFGLPAIVSDAIGCIGPTDTAQPGVNVMTFPCGDVAALANCIAKLTSDQTLWRKMSAAAREIAKTQDVVVAAAQLESAAVALQKWSNADHLPHA